MQYKRVKNRPGDRLKFEFKPSNVTWQPVTFQPMTDQFKFLGTKPKPQNTYYWPGLVAPFIRLWGTPKTRLGNP